MIETVLQTDLLESLGYQEVPEKLWIWALPSGGSLTVRQDGVNWKRVAVSAKGITLVARTRFGVRTNGVGDLVEEGWPLECVFPDGIPSVNPVHGYVLFDDDGNEISRWKV